VGLFDKLKSGLFKTRKVMVEKIDETFASGRVDEDTLERLEEILISADVGVKATMEIVEHLRARGASIKGSNEVKAFIKAEMAAMLGKSTPLIPFGQKPFVILAVGVNGVGKTTTIGKVATRFANDGQHVILGASDTFRAAAIDQLAIWAKRAGAEIVRHQDGSDPAAVAFDSVEAAKARGADVVIVDTAGRLHTKAPLMDELKKVTRVIRKAMPDAPQEVLLVLDATTGQNAIQQATFFNQAVGITGIALTKLDGTAKGGIVFAIRRELGIPVRLVGVGEGVDDLQDFDPAAFVSALFD
jgi:fused signal recognition particle receptor